MPTNSKSLIQSLDIDGLMSLDDSRKDFPAISTGIFGLDQATGIGGVPRGRIVEIFGPEQSGKTTVALKVISQGQVLGPCAFIDTEHSLDIDRAKVLGVDTKSLLLLQPGCAEDALEAVDKLVRSKQICLVVFDSVAAMVPRAEVEGEMGESHMGLHARLMSQAMRKLASLVAQTNTTVLFVNQLRFKIGVMFGNPETTTGGLGLKFQSAMRIDIRKKELVKDGEVVTGQLSRAKIVKNKMAPPYKDAEFEIHYGKDIDNSLGILDFGVRAGKITQSGPFYKYGQKTLGRGRAGSARAIDDPQVRSEVLALLSA